MATWQGLSLVRATTEKYPSAIATTTITASITVAGPVTARAVTIPVGITRCVGYQYSSYNPHPSGYPSYLLTYLVFAIAAVAAMTQISDLSFAELYQAPRAGPSRAAYFIIPADSINLILAPGSSPLAEPAIIKTAVTTTATITTVVTTTS